MTVETPRLRSSRRSWTGSEIPHSDGETTATKQTQTEEGKAIQAGSISGHSRNR